MEVSVTAINKVFISGRILKIPYFQRAYVWKEENWEQFFNDIATIASMDDDESREPYFLGSIIIKDGGVNKDGIAIADVVDGQQRLTTIVIFMKALYLSMGKNDNFKRLFMQMDLDDNLFSTLEPNHNDKAVFNKVINLDILERDLINDSNIAKAFKYFGDRITDSRNGLDEHGLNVTPSEILNTITRYVRLVCIEAQKGENAQKIFETINCAGIKLTTGELLKNYLFDEKNADLYENTWKKVFEQSNLKYWDEDIVKGRIKDSHIENFFYRYLLIKMQDPNISLDADEKKKYRQKGGLFEHFREIREKNKIEKNVMINDVMTFATLYMNTFKNDTLESALVKYEGLERLVCLMYAQDAWTMTPYILYLLNSQKDAVERQKIFGYMETYLIRRIICKSKNNNYSDMFSENLIGQGVNTFADFKAYVNDSAARGALLMPSDEEVNNALTGGDVKRYANLLLYMLESKLNKDFTSSRFTNGYVNFVAEQVMPEKDNDAWGTSGYTADDRKRLVKTLGNFVLIREKLKSADKKGDWGRKKAAMKPHADEVLTSEIVCRDLTEWTEKTIETRNNWFVEKSIEAWPL